MAIIAPCAVAHSPDWRNSSDARRRSEKKKRSPAFNVFQIGRRDLFRNRTLHSIEELPRLNQLAAWIVLSARMGMFGLLNGDAVQPCSFSGEACVRSAWRLQEDAAAARCSAVHSGISLAAAAETVARARRHVTRRNGVTLACFALERGIYNTRPMPPSACGAFPAHRCGGRRLPSYSRWRAPTRPRPRRGRTPC